MNKRDSMSLTAKRFLFNDGSSPTDYRPDLFTTVMTLHTPIHVGNLKDSDLWNIMNVDQYTTRDSRMRSGDVHNQFIDFLVKTAVWHNLIDKPRDFGKNFDKLNILIGNYIDHFSNTNISVTDNFAVYPNYWNYWRDVTDDINDDYSYLDVLVGDHTVINFFQKNILLLMANLMVNPERMNHVDTVLREINAQAGGGSSVMEYVKKFGSDDISVEKLLNNFPSLASINLLSHLEKVAATLDITGKNKKRKIIRDVVKKSSLPQQQLLPILQRQEKQIIEDIGKLEKQIAHLSSYEDVESQKELGALQGELEVLQGELEALQVLQGELEALQGELEDLKVQLERESTRGYVSQRREDESHIGNSDGPSVSGDLSGGGYIDLTDSNKILQIIRKAYDLFINLRSDNQAFNTKPHKGFDYTKTSEYEDVLKKHKDNTTRPELIKSLAQNGGYNMKDGSLANAILQGKLLGEEETHLSMYVLEYVRKNLTNKTPDEFYDPLRNKLDEISNQILFSLVKRFTGHYVNRFRNRSATDNEFVTFLRETVVNPSPVFENDMKTVGNVLREKILYGLKTFLETNINGTHNTLKNEYQKKFWDNTFAKWHDLTPEVQLYLNRYVHLLRKDSDGNWSQVNPLDHRNISESDRANYRVNFKQGTYPYNQFASDLPDLSGFSGSMWYTTNRNGQLAQLPHKNLKKLYLDIYRGKNHNISHPDFNELNSGVTHFHLNYKSFIRKRMERARYYRRKTDDSDANADKDKVKYSSRMWSRDNKGLRRKDIEGKWEYVDELHEKYDACSLLGIDEKDEQLCNKTIIDCLRSNNPNDLSLCRKQFMHSKNWFKNVQEQIKNIHPEYAVDILHSFGFRTEQDEHGIYVIESAHEWKRNLRDNDKLDHQEVEILSSGQNELFFNYLNHLSEWVNSNPAILNESYRGTSVRDRGLTKFAKQHNLTMRPDLVSLRRNMSAREKLRNVIYLFGRQRYDPNRTYTVSLSSGTPLGRGFSVSLGEDPLGMQEGGSVYPMRVSDTLNELMAEHNEGVGGGILKRLVQSVISELETEGRSLDPSDKQKLLRIADHIIELEGELVESINYIDKFNTLRYRIGHTPDAGKVLNYSRLQALVKRHSGLVNRRAKYEDRLAKAFQTLVDYLDSQ